MDPNDLRRDGGGEGGEGGRDLEESQTQMYLGATGPGISQHDVARMTSFLADAAVNQAYQAYRDVRFVYEMMVKPGWEAEVKKMADSWIEVRITAERYRR